MRRIVASAFMAFISLRAEGRMREESGELPATGQRRN